MGKSGLNGNIVEHGKGTNNELLRQANVVAFGEGVKGVVEEQVCLKRYEHLRITDSTPIEEPKAIVSICGAIIATPEDIVALSGIEKGGKSAVGSICLAGAISTDGVIDGLEGLEVLVNINRWAVINIDTEQAKHRQQYNVKTILKRAYLNTCPDHFLSYNIRQLNISEYQEITSGIFEAAQKEFGGIHLVLIDGVADFITSVNDEAEANAIVKFFEYLAIQ
jgi:hypothetical protein